MSHTPVSSVGIVGYGHFGKFVHELAQRFFPAAELRIFSRGVEPDGNFQNLDVVAKSDVVILCGSIRSYESQLDAVLPLLGEQTVLVDVATVKKHTNELFRARLGDRPFLCTHPMFGPESYQKQGGDVSGLRIVVTDHTLPAQQYQTLRNLFSSLGFLIIELTADEHDRYLAETLFLTHYVGQSILKAGFKRTDMDTVSFSFLMDAVESVKDDGQLFADVYRFNPYCEAVAKRLHGAQEEVFKGVELTD